jgi:parallel beta-helix repeat protein
MKLHAIKNGEIEMRKAIAIWLCALMLMGSVFIGTNLFDNSSANISILPGMTSDPTLNGQWNFNEGTGLSANDASGNGNTGTLVNSPSWTADGLTHGAIHLDGVDDIINCGAGASLDPTAAATIEAWVKFDILPTTAGRIFHIAGRSGASTDLDLLATNVNNRFRFYIEAGKYAESSTVIQVGVWYHVVGTYAANNYVRISVNGMQEQNTPISVTRGNNPNDFTIGGSAYWGDRRFQGTIDEVGVWSRAFSASEILASYNTAWQNYLYNETLKGHWNLDEATGQYAIDSSGNDNNGTLMPFYPGNAPTRTNGISGNALEFDGVDDYVGCGSNASLRPTTEITVSAWVNIDTFGNYECIVANGWDTGTTESGYFLTAFSPNLIRFYITTNTMGLVYVSVTTTADSWHHVVGTYDGANLKLYIDGTEKSSLAVNGNIDWSPIPYELYIGRYLDDNELYNFDGTIDEVSVWSRALNVTDIDNLYHAVGPVQNIDTGKNFTTIQAAINEADTLNGHTITVAAGTYYEHVTVNKQLTLNGAGQDVSIINGSGTGTVINITANWVNVTGFKVTGSGGSSADAGIKLNMVVNCNIENNTASNNWNGLHLSSSNGNILKNNNFRLNTWRGIDFQGSSNNFLINNNCTANYMGLYLYSSSNNIIRGNNYSSNSYCGIYTHSSTDNLIDNNQLNFQGLGIYMYEASNDNTIRNNSCSFTQYGLFMYTSTGNTFDNNSCSNGWFGVSIDHCTGNTFTNNTANFNDYHGFDIQSSSTNIIANNTICSNVQNGIYLFASNSNIIYHNNFIDNLYQATDNGANAWNLPYPGGGNYWSDYVGVDAFSGAAQDIPGSDGFGDAPKTFTASQDNFPLMFQSVWWTEKAPVITLVSPANNSVVKASTILNFYVWDENFNLDQATYSVNSGSGTAFGLKYDIDTTGWSDGDYSVEINADDKLGNAAYRQYNFRVDSTNPVFTTEFSMSNDVGADGFTDNGDTLTIWVNVTDANENASTIPAINVDETDFLDQPVANLAYQGIGVWTCQYTIQAGGFNISDIEVSFADLAGNLVSTPDIITFSIHGQNTMNFIYGWNLISFPMDEPTMNGKIIRRASDLANQTSPLMISKWNPLTQSYINYIPGFHLPTDVQNFAIGPDDAVFIFTSTAKSLSASGFKSPGQRSVNLRPGWNLVGYHDTVKGDVETDWASQVSCGALDDICYLDGTTFRHYIFTGTVMELNPGRGYFVWSDSATTLNY